MPTIQQFARLVVVLTTLRNATLLRLARIYSLWVLKMTRQNRQCINWRLKSISFFIPRSMSTSVPIGKLVTTTNPTRPKKRPTRERLSPRERQELTGAKKGSLADLSELQRSAPLDQEQEQIMF